ncbi:hypothetical protein IAQ61_006779 [Plenodomus lingam]|nr:hypothetical protein IAQ61_006779 [Plenodomus lingam]
MPRGSREREKKSQPIVSDDDSDTIVVARHAIPLHLSPNTYGLSKPSPRKETTVYKSPLKEKHTVFAADEEDIKTELDEDVSNDMKQAEPEQPISKSCAVSGYHIILKDEEDYKTFADIMAKYPGANLPNIRILEIHIDTTKLTEYHDFRMALALQEFQPSRNGMIPHRLHTLRVVVKGDVLFTRYAYHLASPAASEDASHVMKKLIRDRLSRKQKSNLMYKLNSTELGISNALLATRGVKQVSIEGTGKVEGNFAQTLLDTLTQPPGTKIIQLHEPVFPFIADEINRTGEICSGDYKGSTLQSRLTLDQSRHDFPDMGEEGREEVASLGVADMVRVRRNTTDTSDALDGNTDIEFGWKI